MDSIILVIIILGVTFATGLFAIVSFFLDILVKYLILRPIMTVAGAKDSTVHKTLNIFDICATCVVTVMATVLIYIAFKQWYLSSL